MRSSLYTSTIIANTPTKNNIYFRKISTSLIKYKDFYQYTLSKYIKTQRVNND